jgi:hypothetical protein
MNYKSFRELAIDIVINYTNLYHIGPMNDGDKLVEIIAKELANQYHRGKKDRNPNFIRRVK